MKRILLIATLLLSGFARADENTHAKDDAFYAEAARLAPPFKPTVKQLRAPRAQEVIPTPHRQR